MSADALSEQWLIDVVTAAVPVPSSPEGPGDDAALVRFPPAGAVVTTDALVEGVHFLRAHPAEALGWKALAVNLSDVAAMGARPTAFLLTAGVPDDLPAAWWRAFAAGLGACARAAGTALVGGDIVRSPLGLTLNVVAWGEAPADGRLLTRAGGRPGDVLLARGGLGRSALGWRRWEAIAGPGWAPGGLHGDLASDPALRAHLRPEPDLDAGPRALALGARAGMDLSDGLATDLPRLARASGVALVVDLERLPDDPVCAELSAEERAAGGEDYGLVVLAPPDAASALEAAGFAAIGHAVESSAQPGGAPVLWRRAGRAVTIPRAFTHFAGG
ncbi:MAG: thiamine-phosphate kinase [Deltaproteobacteria bacterium]|nr:thiamine-phosphate kinase [Deltaproteobacteria bacterium]